MDAADDAPDADMDQTMTDENQDCEMRKYWATAVLREMTASGAYHSVAVLILHWSEELDLDLRCGAEARDLDRFFKDRLGYQTMMVTIDNHPSHDSPQDQLNGAIAEFVEYYDGARGSNLLIVYYTGHGWADPPQDGNDEGQSLIISGREAPSGSPNSVGYEPEAKWTQAESYLNDADVKADVLVILDCCFAGSLNIGGFKRENLRSYELLAACGKDGITSQPGPNSYTRGLINCLEEVLGREKIEDPCISTFDLNQWVVQRRSEASSHVYNRLKGLMSRHIVLAPLKPEAELSIRPLSQAAGHLTLRFACQEHSCLNKEQLERLVTLLVEAAKKSDLGISSIEWISFDPGEQS